MKSIRTEPRNHAGEGDERIRTAVCCFTERTPDQSGATVYPALGHRLACLADGEGHFAIDKRNRQSRSTGIFHREVNPIFACGFYVQQRDDDREFLETFQKQTGLGRIYSIAAKQTPGRRNNPKVRWAITRMGECLELVRILDAYPLWSKKAVEYELWRLVVMRWNEPRVIEREWWEARRDQLMAMRKYKEARP